MLVPGDGRMETNADRSNIAESGNVVGGVVEELWLIAVLRL